MIDTDILVGEFDHRRHTDAEEDAYNSGWLAREYGGDATPPDEPNLRLMWDWGWRAAELERQQREPAQADAS